MNLNNFYIKLFISFIIIILILGVIAYFCTESYTNYSTKKEGALLGSLTSALQTGIQSANVQTTTDSSALIGSLTSALQTGIQSTQVTTTDSSTTNTDSSALIGSLVSDAQTTLQSSKVPICPKNAPNNVCGTDGQRIRTRTVMQPSLNGGIECGKLTEISPCKNVACVNCKVSEWSNWTDTDVIGTQERSRTVVEAAGIGGEECGELKQTQTIPVDCTVGEWGDWTYNNEANINNTTQNEKTPEELKTFCNDLNNNKLKPECKEHMHDYCLQGGIKTDGTGVGNGDYRAYFVDSSANCREFCLQNSDQCKDAAKKYCGYKDYIFRKSRTCKDATILSDEEKTKLKDDYCTNSPTSAYKYCIDKRTPASTTFSTTNSIIPTSTIVPTSTMF